MLGAKMTPSIPCWGDLGAMKAPCSAGIPAFHVNDLLAVPPMLRQELVFDEVADGVKGLGDFFYWRDSFF